MRDNHEQRVIEEQTDLQSRIERLDAFTGSVIYNDLHAAERARLVAQFEHMRKYNDVLLSRIAAFKPER